MSNIMRKLRYVANQNPTLGPIITALSDLTRTSSPLELATKPHLEEAIRVKQQKLSEITDMIHAAHVFHRCVRDQTSCDKTLHQDTIMSLLFGDYLLAQSSVDMADLRYPRTVGLIAKGLEDYTRGEFLKLSLFQQSASSRTNESSRRIAIESGLKQYVALTCGSLLSNACLSSAILAGHPDRAAGAAESQLADLVHQFGHHTGSAHRLIEILHYPDTNSEPDDLFIKSLEPQVFDEAIKSHLDESVKLLMQLPEGERRHSLMSILKGMRNRSLSLGSS